MSLIDAIILGIIQGLTEFLPVSSSGHLVLTEAILGVRSEGVTFELMVHVGSLVAVLIYFRRKIFALIAAIFDSTRTRERKMLLYLILATIPIVLGGLLLIGFIRTAFSSPVLASVFLFVTGLILFSTRFARPSHAHIGPARALIIGVAQVLALLPGISRSGSTISAGLIAGVEPAEAAEFSFLLSIPAILGALVLKWRDLVAVDTSLIPQYVTGTVVSFLCSLLAVYAVLRLVRRGKFIYFSYYCFAAGALGLYLFW